MDDTILKSPQAREDTAVSMIEAGLVPNMVHRPLHGVADVDALYAECQKLGDRGIYVCRISRASAERGLEAGASFGLLIAGMPENIRGRVMLTFDGWADDQRGLWTIPEVVDFCNGLIYGPDPMNNPDPAHPAMARAVLPFLMDEEKMVRSLGRQAWDIAGRNWVISVAHAAVVYTGSTRDAGLAMGLYDVFMG